MPSLSSLLRTVVALGGLFATVHSFAPSLGRATSTTTTLLHQSTTTESFIDTELRGAAMRLHTRSQAPKEGQAAEEDDDDEQRPNYVTTHADYLRFLVDSQHVYQALEDIVNSDDRLAVFRSTGLERTAALTTDIAYMMEEYHLERPAVGKAGLDYAKHLRQITSVPEFVCHFYNFYFAHTAGGRMIGKQMSALLLDKKTLEFYKWEGDLNAIKAAVKADIEAMAASWSAEERAECVAATPDTFRLAGAINKYLSGQGED